MYAHMLAVYAYALLLTLCSVYIPYHDSKKLPCKVAKKTNNVWAALFSLTNIIYLYTNTQLRWISCVEVSATESQLVHNTVARSHLGFPANLREQNTKKFCSHIRTKLGALRPPKYLGQKVFLHPFEFFCIILGHLATASIKSDRTSGTTCCFSGVVALSVY